MGRALVGGKRGGSADLEAFGLELGGVEGVDGVEEEGEGGRIAAAVPQHFTQPHRRLPFCLPMCHRRRLPRAPMAHTTSTPPICRRIPGRAAAAMPPPFSQHFTQPYRRLFLHRRHGWAAFHARYFAMSPLHKLRASANIATSSPNPRNGIASGTRSIGVST